jgi:hypothetical protein
VFLAVTAILLYQVSSGEHETAAIGAIAATPPIVSVTPPPALSPTIQPTQPLPTATKSVVRPTATATLPPAEPTIETIATEARVEEPVVADGYVDETIDDGVGGDEAEPAAEEVSSGQVSLAAIDTSDAWSGAIETPNGGMIGTVLSALANVRALPVMDAEVVDVLHGGWPVAIYGAALGDTVADTELWYQVSGGGYVSAALIAPFEPLAREATYSGHWVDVDLTRNVAIAYINDVPVNAVTVITGKAGFETPVGAHTIFARVESETLDSATVGIPKGDPEYYYLPDVPYTQYFATGGFAIHSNYWSDPWQFGTDSSHGCVNMLPEDAAWFWWFLDIGSVVNVHY